MTSLPYIDEETLFDLVGWSDAVTALQQALVDGLNPARAAPRSIIDVTNGQLLLMPAEIAQGVGIKVGTVTPANPDRGLPRIQALYLLLDGTTHEPVALMDGTALTTLRTPAVSALAAQHLARPDASAMVVFGSGPQAWGHVEAVRAVRPIESAVVVGRDRGRAEALVERLAADGLAATVGTADAVAHADVVACTTTAREPLFDGRLLRADACVLAVGSHEPDAREMDDVVLSGAERIVVETPAVAMREAGDVIIAVQSGAISEADLVGIAEAVTLEPVAGRSVFKSVGMGWQDLVVAGVAHQRWRESAGA
jgi:ornithine cyclodeaminase/alanine dehydrogenase-like protein (mu-crystallin family)